ncbi:MAG TPA: amidohydrolase family protein [Gemmatimonadota bacterium]|nr:amidohydrolase family protein [Gemmatimonadota bacterium]
MSLAGERRIPGERRIRGELRITDVHVHIQPWEELKPAVLARMAQGRSDFEDLKRMMGDPDAVLARMDEAGVARIGVINYVSPDLMGFTERVNPWVAELARSAPERLIPFGGVDPWEDEGGEQVDRLLELGVRAIKLHPPHQEVQANAYREGLTCLEGVYRRAAEIGMPIMVHTGTSIFPGARNVYADPLPLDDVGVDFPELTVILAHLGRPLWAEASFFLLRRHPNFWGDVSGIPPKGLLRYFPRLAEVADKLLWGTDWPGPMVPGLRKNLDDFLSLQLSDDVRLKLLQDNPDRLFGLAPAL